MVNKREKNEGAKKTAAKTAPKGRVVSKPKAATRTASVVPAVKAALPAKKKSTKPAAKPAAKAVAIRQEDVAFRAYLMSEKREQLGLPGDSLSDWVEAERQLLGERATHGVN